MDFKETQAPYDLEANHTRYRTRQLLQIITAACTVFFVTPCHTAGPPIPFNSFSVTNGKISAACPEYAVCDNPLQGNGMFQRKVSIPGQGSFIQSIITEAHVTGDAAAEPFSTERGNIAFTNEDFVKVYNRGSGHSSKQTLMASSFPIPDIETRFFYSQEYNWGWAHASNTPWIVTSQEVSEVDYRLNELNPQVTFMTKADIKSDPIGFKDRLDVSLAQMVSLAGPEGDINDAVGKFAYKKLLYKSQISSRTADGTLLPGGTNGGDISWNYLDSISALWIGQHIKVKIDNDNNFGITHYQNLSQGTETKLISDTNPNAVNWLNLPFGSIEDIFINDIQVLPTPDLIPPTMLASIPVGTVATDTTTAHEPMAFNLWTVLDGELIAGCDTAAGIICHDPIANERGMFQRKISVPNNEAGFDDYFQFVITDTAATGDPTIALFEAGSLGYKYEGYTKANAYGLAAQMHISNKDLTYRDYSYDSNDPRRLMNTDSGEISLNAQIKSGWARGGPLDPTVIITQQVTMPDEQWLHSSSMDSAFKLTRGDTQADRILDIAFIHGTAAGGVYDPESGEWIYNRYGMPIMFATSKVEGAFQKTTRLASDPDLLPSVEGNITWSPGDALHATWLAFVYTTPNAEVFFNQGRLTAYTNLSTGASTKAMDANWLSGSDLSNFNPESWVSPFTQPPPSVSFSLGLPPPEL